MTRAEEERAEPRSGVLAWCVAAGILVGISTTAHVPRAAPGPAIAAATATGAVEPRAPRLAPLKVAPTTAARRARASNDANKRAERPPGHASE
jgi:hypothetical protein